MGREREGKKERERFKLQVAFLLLVDTDICCMLKIHMIDVLGRVACKQAGGNAHVEEV